MTIFFFSGANESSSHWRKSAGVFRYVVSGFISFLDTCALLATVGFIVSHTKVLSSKNHVLLPFLWRFSGLYTRFLDVLLGNDGNGKVIHW